MGFDFSARMSDLCHDLVMRVEALRHIRMECVAVCFAQSRKPVVHGMWASLTPLRFAQGAAEMTRGNRRFVLQRLQGPQGQEMLYILRFYLPRFLDLAFWDALTTVTHELWHISPDCDGDIRRFPGRCAAHSSRKRDFDAQADALASRYLQTNPPSELRDFLHLDSRALQARHGAIFGRRIPQPKLIPLEVGRPRWH